MVFRRKKDKEKVGYIDRFGLVIKHAVTCAIPAASQVEHMQQNMQVMKAELSGAAMR